MGGVLKGVGSLASKAVGAASKAAGTVASVGKVVGSLLPGKGGEIFQKGLGMVESVSSTVGKVESAFQAVAPIFGPSGTALGLGIGAVQNAGLFAPPSGPAAGATTFPASYAAPSKSSGSLLLLALVAVAVMSGKKGGK